jgi:hypothetical protein
MASAGVIVVCVSSMEWVCFAVRKEVEERYNSGEEVAVQYWMELRV